MGYIIIGILLFSLFITKSAHAEAYIIKVDFTLARLSVLSERNYEIASFPVALSKITPKLPFDGWVEKVEFNPYWAPTSGTREAYFQKFGIELPVLIFPGDARNAMGKVKLHIVWNDPNVNKTIRIHGTNEPKSIGMRVSRGCIRMHNDDIEVLAKIIKNKEVLILFTK